jgi:exopolysaccharide biosynthesis polyprenyl glycosylphosphotransferase
MSDEAWKGIHGGGPRSVAESAPLVPRPIETPPAQRRRFGAEPRVRRLLADGLPAAAAALTVALFGDVPYEGAVLSGLVFLCTSVLVSPPPSWAPLLPMMRFPIRALKPVVAVGLLMLIQALTGLPGLDATEVTILLGATMLAALVTGGVPRRRWGVDGPVRTAVIGSPRYAADLAHELAVARVDGYAVVGCVPHAVTESPISSVPALGALSELGELVEKHDIRLLVMTGEVPRFLVFEEVSRSCLHLPVRLWELSGFYEDVFGHVAVADINASWFQYIMHPNFRAIGPGAKRALDVAVATVTLLLAAPLLAVLALIVRRDGGPVLFRQTRIGEGGRPLTVYKLRTMRVGDAHEQYTDWASKDDPRITRVGRFMRRTHVDELPQLVNVLRGDMTLVGPRPEQPEFVDRLEDIITFYARRHLVKPGLTGWAQVRCGYAGSDIGSAWKLSHDLYYIKHRSLAFDLAILCETVRTIFFDRQYAVEPPGLSFIYPGEPRPVAVAPPETEAAAPRAAAS